MIAWEKCPESVREQLKNYVEKHHTTGGFLRCVLTNDLFGALFRADETNSPIIKEICRFIQNEVAPTRCYGSKDLYYEWISIGQEKQFGIGSSLRKVE